MNSNGGSGKNALAPVHHYPLELTATQLKSMVVTTVIENGCIDVKSQVYQEQQKAQPQETGALPNLPSTPNQLTSTAQPQQPSVAVKQSAYQQPTHQCGLWDIDRSGLSLNSLSRLNSMECWDYTIELECLRGPEDLQLAAELGKTLLERNKELESSLKHHQNIIEDQVQEIEYLTKQNAALREVNDSRMKIYEQLEVSIQDLERDKYKLALDNQAEKKHVKQLCRNIETLEAKVEELTRTAEDTRRLLDVERKNNERLQIDSSMREKKDEDNVKKQIIKPDPDECAASGPDYDELAEVSFKPENYMFAFKNQSSSSAVTDGGHGQSSHTELDINLADENEELIKIMHELERTRKCFISEQNRVAELEEQLAAIAQENQILQSKLVHINTTEEIKSVHDELSILEEVRQGQMCTRCLRGCEDRQDDESIITGTEDDDHSLMDLIQSTNAQHIYRSSVTIQTSSKPDSMDLLNATVTNPYRELVEKYEALLEVQRNSSNRKNSNQQHAVISALIETELKEVQQQEQESSKHQPQQHQPSHANVAQIPTINRSITQQATLPTALSSELNTGDFGSLNMKYTGDDAPKKEYLIGNGANRCKIGLRTPTDFSEAETTSSGFSDEISHKATQTDDRPHNFLCTIADGNDCKFSIYEDQTAIDSRFRFSPSHRELFREIFTILKKAAENRDEGEQLPLLDDTNPQSKINIALKVPPVTPANEEPPSELGMDDTQSMISSAISEQSFAMSECITKSERKKIEKQSKYAEKHGEQENQPPIGVQALPDGRILTPYKRQPLEYLTVAVGVKKKSRRRRNRGVNSDNVGDRSNSPVAIPTPPRVYTSSSKKGRSSYRPWVPSAGGSTAQCDSAASTSEWNGSSMTIYNRTFSSSTSPGPSSNDATAQLPNTSATSIPRPAEADFKVQRNRFADLTDDSGEIVEFKPSSASQHLHKLQKLDLSYAEVLRRADNCKHHSQRRQK